MAKIIRKAVAKQPKKEEASHSTFSGTVQVGPARGKRAHALAEELVARGCAYIQKMVFDEAAREFRKAIKIDQTYAEAHNNLGLALLYAEKPDEAVDAILVALEHFPGWPLAEANLGLAYQRLNDFESAAENYRRALGKKRQQPNIWFALGDVYSQLNRNDEALDAYETAIQLSPNFGMAHYRVGMLNARKNRIAEAEASLRRALQLDPDNIDATAVLGAIAARKGDLITARDYFQQVQDYEDIPAPAQKGLRRLSVFDRGLNRALEEWKGSMPEVPTVAECYFQLGVAQIMAGNESAAKMAFQQAADIQLDWADPMIWFGFFAAKDGDAITAKNNWEAVLKAEPDNGMLHEQLGYLALAMGLTKEADARFKQATSLGRKIPAEDLMADAAASNLMPKVQ